MIDKSLNEWLQDKGLQGTQDRVESKPHFDERDQKDLETLVFTALGAASSCWENLEGAGVFESTKCKEIGDELVELLKARFGASSTPVDSSGEDGERQNLVGRSWLR